MRKNQQGFGVVEILLVLVVIGLLGLVGWVFFSKQKDSSKNESATANNQLGQTTEDKNKEQLVQGVAKTTITPFLGSKSFTVSLPEGWERNTRISESSPVYSKTVGSATYFISFVNGEVNTGTTGPEGNTTEGFLNQEGHKNTVLKSVTTSKGTKLYLVKSVNELSGGGVLLLSSSQPNPNNSYIEYEGQNLGINIQRDGVQSVAEINFSEPGVDIIINDLESIATSLSV